MSEGNSSRATFSFRYLQKPLEGVDINKIKGYIRLTNLNNLPEDFSNIK
ncbi:MAG: hypothetical protein STSR0008_18700 [Ignavibacterium sp.]